MTTKRGRASTEDKLNIVPMSGARVAPPAGLTKEELKEWNDIVQSLPADYFRPADIPLLSTFCTASAFYKQCKRIVDEEGLILTNERGNSYKNPATDIMQSQAATMAQLAVKLRLCPSSRYTDRGAGAKHGGKAKGARPWEAHEG